MSTQDPNLRRIQTYTGSPENHSPHSTLWHFEIWLFMRAACGLFLLKGRFSSWDWPNGRIAWSTAILAVTGRCFVRSRIILPPVRLSSVVHSFTSTSGGNTSMKERKRWCQSFWLCIRSFFFVLTCRIAFLWIYTWEVVDYWKHLRTEQLQLWFVEGSRCSTDTSSNFCTGYWGSQRETK